MSNYRLAITDAKIDNGKIIITKMSIIETETGKVSRIASITPELLDFFKRIEIDLTLWMQLEELKEKNPDVKKLISTFGLCI